MKSILKFTATALVVPVFIMLSSSTALAFLACQITDTAGVDDKSFNQKAWSGMQRAKDELGIEIKVLESASDTDYAPNINALVAQNCDIIITLGFRLGKITSDAATANPNTKFSIVDFAYDPPVSNILSQLFATDQAAFIAGYLAAGTTKTGTISTFGGINLPSVAAFMDGYTRGAMFYNAKHNTDVKVLGWDIKKKDGLFTGNFKSLADGRAFAQNLYDEGADIVLPVAASVGLGSAALAAELGADKLKIIGVDADNALTNPEAAHVYLTSILKQMDTTVVTAISKAKSGDFKSGSILGTIENGGVDIAPFHSFEGKIPEKLLAELKEVRAGIIDGSIKTRE